MHSNVTWYPHLDTPHSTICLLAFILYPLSTNIHLLPSTLYISPTFNILCSTFNPLPTTLYVEPFPSPHLLLVWKSRSNYSTFFVLPYTLNRQHPTPNLYPLAFIFNPLSSTIYLLPSAIYPLSSIIYNLPSSTGTLHPTFHHQPATFYILPSIVYHLPSIFNPLPSIFYHLPSTLLGSTLFLRHTWFNLHSSCTPMSTNWTPMLVRVQS